jgi:hypothetical protein
MEGWRQLQECYSATVERCSAVGIAVPAPVTNYMRGYQALTNIKSRLAAAIPYFIDTNNKSDGNYTNYFLVNTNATSLPVLTATGLLASLQMPTNYLIHTPYLNLSGLGPFTNDTTVPYPHGFTNSFTQTGGTNFPASRSTWYDTDYGIAAVTTLCARLTDVSKTPAVTVDYAGTSDAGLSWSRTNTYAVIVANIDSYFVTNLPTDTYFGERSRTQNKALGNYSAKAQASWVYSITNTYTNTSVNVEWLMNVKKPTEFPPDGTQTFGNVSFTFTEDCMNLVSSETVTPGTALILSPRYGTYTNPCGVGMPDFPSPYPTDPWRSVYGWEFKNTHLVVFSYDFKFK